MAMSLSSLYLSFFAAFDVVLATSLNVTAIGAKDGSSRFECWELAAPFVSSSQTGIAGSQTTFLGDVSNITYNVIPAGFDSGVHNTPRNQWIIVLNGLAVITLPDNSSVTVATSPGEMGLLFAADTPEVSREGHGNYFPGVSETIFLQVPTKDGAIPEHKVLNDDGPCTPNKYTALRGWATG
ncbi:hypothetical protein GL218_08059 [Daldinia childiae]|uniref:uncharacterized protein n=1 Tax=Daldinia childiae TaxID=326645 RepID=UPI00144793AC|nr:uncharacterized protein GL218_08059 [Daldinia childiae]KAF3068947.1 hypothetical protein GL218_08059 [Daldinia childiae]